MKKLCAYTIGIIFATLPLTLLVAYLFYLERIVCLILATIVLICAIICIKED